MFLMGPRETSLFKRFSKPRSHPATSRSWTRTVQQNDHLIFPGHSGMIEIEMAGRLIADRRYLFNSQESSCSPDAPAYPVYNGGPWLSG